MKFNYLAFCLFILFTSQCGGTPNAIDEVRTTGISSGRYAEFTEGVKKEMEGRSGWSTQISSIDELVSSEINRRKFNEETPELVFPQISEMYLLAYDKPGSYSADVAKIVAPDLSKYESVVVAPSVELALVQAETDEDAFIVSSDDRTILAEELINQLIITTHKYSKGGETDKKIVKETVFAIASKIPDLEGKIESLINSASVTMSKILASSDIYIGVIGGLTRKAKVDGDFAALKMIGERSIVSAANFGSAALPIVSKIVIAAMVDELESVEDLQASTEGILSADVGDAFQNVLKTSYEAMRKKHPEIDSQTLMKSVFEGACQGVKKKIGGETCPDLGMSFKELATSVEIDIATEELALLIASISPESESEEVSDAAGSDAGTSTDADADDATVDTDAIGGAGSDDADSDSGDDSGTAGDVEEPVEVCPTLPYGSGIDGDVVIGDGLTTVTKTLGSDIVVVDRTVSSQQVYAPDWANFVAAESDSLLTITGNGDGLAVGDDVLVYIVKGIYSGSSAEDLAAYEERVGSYSVGCITALTAVGSDTQLTFKIPLGVEKEATDTVVVQRVPQFNSLTIKEDATLTVPAWDGSSGGILAFKVKGIFELKESGTIELSGLGYTGGDDSFPENYLGTTTDRPGAGYVAPGTAIDKYGQVGAKLTMDSVSIYVGGGSGGGTRYYKNSSSSCPGGNGFADGTSGTCINSGSSGPSICCGLGGSGGGAPYAAPLMPTLGSGQVLFGTGATAGAGGGGTNGDPAGTRAGGSAGENGGGALLFFANEARLFGILNFVGGSGGNGGNGANGVPGTSGKASGGGGGGSGGFGGVGGSFYGKAGVLMVIGQTIDLTGGSGGAGGNRGNRATAPTYSSVRSGYGGAGGGDGEDNADGYTVELSGTLGTGLIEYTTAIGPLPDLTAQGSTFTQLSEE